MSILIKISNCVKISLNKSQRKNLRKYQGLRFRGLQHLIYRTLIGSNLKALATVYGSDKWGSHWYAQHYETFFSSIRQKKLKILEIGIGGYTDPEFGGGSLRMWRTYFPKSQIYGIDIFDKSLHDEHRIKTFKGSQTDDHFLQEVQKTIGQIDIIIDDGSHQNEHILFTFNILFPQLNENGIYVIEDTGTSYWVITVGLVRI